MSDIKILEFAKKTGEQIPDWSQDGKTISVYSIPIDKLYYNDDNGRIATWISIYNDTPNNIPLTELRREEFNDTIHDIIKKSNTPSSYKKTLQDIKMKGQINPGVVLSDGRIVSGNRRFTVLRDLYKETGNEKFRFFKCFVVEKDLVNENDRKDIKTIERLTQFGVDEKVDYDPIDRLVDIYNDLVGPKRMWNINEYSKKLSLKKGDVETMYYKALVMADYLDYINQSNKFYIAKKYKLDGPLQEIGKLYKKISCREEWNRIRVAFYSFFKSAGDRTRDIRELVTLYNNNPEGFNQTLKNINRDIENQEIKIFENIKRDSSSNRDENFKGNSQSQLNLTIPIEEAISDDTLKNMFHTVQQTKIDVKKQEKIKKIIDAIDTIVLNLDDTYDLLDTEEKRKITRKINELKEKLNYFTGK